MLLKSIQYSMWCDRCDDFTDYQEIYYPDSPKRYYIKQGWKYLKESNEWICKKCHEIALTK